MHIIPRHKTTPDASAKSIPAASGDLLRQQAFDNSLQANIISAFGNEKILIANNAACKLLCYSKKELQSFTTSMIFDTHDNGFKKMLKENLKQGNSISHVTAIDKNGNHISCEITSAVFLDEKGAKKVITTIADMSKAILAQKNIDIKNEKRVADNIKIAKLKQKDIDILQNKLKEKQISDARRDARDSERAEIGKELHDNVNQLLGASRLYLEMGKRGGTDSEMYFARSSQYILSAIEEIRKLTKGLVTDIKNLGLRLAIENIAHDTMEVSSIEISCHVENFIENSVNDKFKLNAFRIIQEQLNNILKHANATKMNINLSQNKKSVSLVITDNGIGFDTNKKYIGIGIENIKSRAKAYNGNARFISYPGKGCALKLSFPVTDALVAAEIPANNLFE